MCLSAILLLLTTGKTPHAILGTSNTWRADGHAINRGQRSGSTTLGIEPAFQWRFGDSNFVGAAGVLFTVAGQNALDAIYPNFSIQWYWRKAGKVIMQ